MLYLLFIFTAISGFAFDNEVPQKRILPTIQMDEQRPLEWLPAVKSYQLTVKHEGRLLYDHEVNLNPQGFRITQSDLQHENKVKHLFFAGCSFTFGQGVKDKEAFPYLVSKELNDWRVVNMGIRGAAPHDLFYFWQALNFPEIYKPQEGMMIFTLVPDHFERWARSWRYLFWAYENSPVYEIENNQMVLKDVLKERWDYKIARAFRNMGGAYYFLKLTHLHSNYLIEQTYHQMPQVILNLKQVYLKRYPKGRFVVTWMNNPIIGSDKEYKYFMGELKRLNIEVWEPTNSLIPEGKTWQIPGDSHPSPWAHENFYKFLMQKITTTSF